MISILCIINKTNEKYEGDNHGTNRKAKRRGGILLPATTAAALEQSSCCHHDLNHILNYSLVYIIQSHMNKEVRDDTNSLTAEYGISACQSSIRNHITNQIVGLTAD